MIARGSDVKEYATTVTDQTAGTSGTATIANSRTYAYKFSPELISIPTKEAEDNIINTANSGPWIYDASATLKPSREIRVGDLLITKILDDYRQREKEVGDNPRLIKDPATFVFEVTAYEKTDNEDKTQAPVIYHDYVSIVFDAFGTKSVLIGELPVDSFVVVKEEYHGNYAKLFEDLNGYDKFFEVPQVVHENRNQTLGVLFLEISSAHASAEHGVHQLIQFCLYLPAEFVEFGHRLGLLHKGI